MRTAKSSPRRAAARAKRFDWSKVDATADRELARQVRGDRDAPPLATAKQIRADLKSGKAQMVRPPTRVDVRDIRRRLALSQESFASRFGFSLGSLRNWEQGRRQPDGAARVLLTVIAREPEAVARALGVR